MSSTNIHGQKRGGKEEREGLKKEGMRRRKEKRKTRRDGIDSGRIRIGTVQTRNHSTAQLLSVVLCWLEREKEWLPLPCKVEELQQGRVRDCISLADDSSQGNLHTKPSYNMAAIARLV